MSLNVNKQDLIDAVSESAGLTKTQSKAAIDALFATVTAFLVAGKNVPINNFGKFSPVQRKARNGINPSNQLPIKIPASISASFKASSRLKEVLNAKKKK